ncbi:capsule assembly Wzi family protein [Mucilaginibacter sp. P25]|uniref:capsule assembly Wzi family protein n=1 Tax=unclassified Mucilaginibacter TaxID=2617802 RepID=UPI003D66DBE0
MHISLEAQGIVTTNNSVPFWLRANQFGSIPLSGGSGSLIGKIRKDYDTTKTYDWAASFEGRGNAGNNSKFILVEGFVKAHAGIFELKAGRSKDIVGLVDSTLSSGSFSISGNALGIPKISLGIPDFYSIPVLGKLFAFKATLANGYLGSVKVRTGEKPSDFKGYYMENTLSLKIGKPSWRFDFLASYNHEALWGNERRVFKRFELSPVDTYWYVLSGKLYQGSKVGNHLGSIDIGAQYKFDALTISVYRQSFYDIGALKSLANIADGLNGISLVNNKPIQSSFYWKKFLFEFLYTANQAGTLSSKPTKSGAENYYNNYEYAEGWSYNDIGLGTPFITTINDVKSKAGKTWQFFINNRVLALHAATQVYVNNWLYTAKLSYSKNMGTFENGTEIYRSLGGKLKYPPHYGTFKKVNQYSTFVEGLRPLRNGYSVGYDLAYDHGGLLYNSFGIILKLSKTFM